MNRGEGGLRFEISDLRFQMNRGEGGLRFGISDLRFQMEAKGGI
jgi:hypothetical protein